MSAMQDYSDTKGRVLFLLKDLERVLGHDLNELYQEMQMLVGQAIVELSRVDGLAIKDVLRDLLDSIEQICLRNHFELGTEEEILVKRLADHYAMLNGS